MQLVCMAQYVLQVQSKVTVPKCAIVPSVKACVIFHNLKDFLAAIVQAVFNDVKGDECVFLWRAIGAALVSVVSVTSYSLKVCLSTQVYLLS